MQVKTVCRLAVLQIKTIICLLAVLSTALMMSIPTTQAFSILQPVQKVGGGGRVPSQPDRIDGQQSPFPPQGVSECRLIICQITDVYTLENFASFKTMIKDIKENNKDATVVSVLTGDFLSPYLLSSVDKGAGMMNALNRIPLDYLTWGNHETDIDHKTVCKHVAGFRGKFINSNMLDHEAMEHQQEYDVIELISPDGSQQRRVGLCAVLSNDPDLYSHFPAPGAFGGATITDPWEALKKYKTILEQEEQCDLVIPLQHLYVPDDHITCREFDFPLILSGHDHHRVDEVVAGTRLIKAGMNAVYSAIVEVSWNGPEADKPVIQARFAKCSDWNPDPELQQECERAYEVLAPLRNTEIAKVPPEFEPLSSADARSEVCSMGKYLCTLVKQAMNSARPNQQVDAVLLMGGNIRGNVEKYPEGSFFSLEMLQQEIKADETLAVVPMPGWLLAEGVQATHGGEPIPGWMQYDAAVQQDADGRVTHVGGTLLDTNRVYRVATKVSDLTNGQSPPWTQYYQRFPEALPPKGSYINIQSEIMTYMAKNLWDQLLVATAEEIGVEDLDCVIEGCPNERFEQLDTTGSGELTVREIQLALEKYLDLSVDQRETTLAELVHSVADTTGDGRVTVADFERYCEDMSFNLIEKQVLSSVASAAELIGKIRVDLFGPSPPPPSSIDDKKVDDVDSKEDAGQIMAKENEDVSVA